MLKILVERISSPTAMTGWHGLLYGLLFNCAASRFEQFGSSCSPQWRILLGDCRHYRCVSTRFLVRPVVPIKNLVLFEGAQTHRIGRLIVAAPLFSEILCEMELSGSHKLARSQQQQLAGSGFLVMGAEALLSF